MRVLTILTIFIISTICFAQDSNPEILLKSGTFTPNNKFILEDVWNPQLPEIYAENYTMKGVKKEGKDSGGEEGGDGGAAALLAINQELEDLGA